MRLAHWTVALSVCAIGSTVAGERVSARVGTASYDCAPWDGLALRLELPVVGAGPARTLHLALYPVREPQGGQRYEVKFQAGTGQADAWLGRDGAQHDRASSGSVWLERFLDGKGATGRFALTLANGPSFEGRFSARWKNPAPRFLCG